MTHSVEWTTTYYSCGFGDPGDGRGLQEVWRRVRHVADLDDELVHGHVPGVEGRIRPSILKN